ncbi:MAG: M6 family metalloprotease domain-containing protein [Verrucomicrobiota bacterium]
MKKSIRFAKFIVLLCLAGSFMASVQAAPYGPKGRPIRWTQPSGAKLELRVFGDDLYARTETQDGYTVVFDQASATYFYAHRSSDRTELLATNIPADAPPPPTVATHLEVSPEIIAKKRAFTLKEWDGGRSTRWRNRVRAARGRTAAGSQMAPAKAAAPLNGNVRGLTIIVQFPDDPATTGDAGVRFPASPAKIERMMNAAEYREDGNAGSVREYFLDQSGKKLNYTQVISPLITLPNPKDFYNFADYPRNSQFRGALEAGNLLLNDALDALVSQGFNFGNLTVGDDGTVLGTNIFFAGADSGAWALGLWPHQASLYTERTVGTGRAIFRYQITNVPNAQPTIGTFIHESGHLLLDFPDLYDYGYESEGVGQHCLMGSGNYNDDERTPAPINISFKDVLGWAKVTDINPNDSLIAKLPSTGNVGYRIVNPDAPEEYFIVENRGVGDRWAAGCPDQGLMIWHIDNATIGNDSEEMLPDQHYQVSLEQADGLFDLESGANRGDNGDLFDVNTQTFGDLTTPDAAWWDRSESGLLVRAQSPPGAEMKVQFGPVPVNTILVLSPDGNETLFANTRVPITWEATIRGNVRIELLANEHVVSVIADKTANDGVFSWTVPAGIPVGTKYRIRIRSLTNPVAASDVSNDFFSVIPGNFPLDGEVPFGWKKAKGAHAGWEVADAAAYEGKFSMVSRPIGDGKRASVSYTSDFHAGKLTFYVKTSTEEDYDRFYFLLDGERVTLNGSTTGISGDQEWQFVSVNVPDGRHTLTWTYAKDDSFGSQIDRCWIDGVVLPRESQEIVVRGRKGAELTSRRSAVKFPATPVSRSSRVQLLRIVNSGNATLRGIKASISGGSAGSFEILRPPAKTELKKGEFTSLTVRFTPKKPGKLRTLLRIDSNDSNENPFYLPLSGKARPIPVIRVFQPALTELLDNRATVRFSNARVGGGSAKTFTIHNTGRVALKNIQMVKLGRDRQDFIVGPLGVRELAPGELTTFKVYFRPGAARLHRVELLIRSNDLRRSPFNVDLVGTGVRGGAKASPQNVLVSAKANQASAAARLTTVQSIAAIEGEKFRTLTVVKPEDVAQTVVIEVSGDRVHWFSGARHTTILHDNARILKARDNTPLDGEGNRHIRHRILNR